jgi:anti-sigma B factor antagonist
MKNGADNKDDWTRVVVAGNIDHQNSQEFSEELLNRINCGERRLLLDLGRCEFISSSGLGAIAAALMVARSRGGDMEILNACANVRNLFKTTKLNTIIRITKSPE